MSQVAIMVDLRRASTDDEARRHARRRRCRRSRQRRREDPRQSRFEKTSSCAPYTIQSLFADGVNL